MEKDLLQRANYYDDTVMDQKISEICFNIKKARVSAGITQLELAKKINKKRNVISRIESEGGNITLKTLFDIIERGLNGKIKIIIEVNGSDIVNSK